MGSGRGCRGHEPPLQVCQGVAVDILALWEKLKRIPKSENPTDEARKMISSGELSQDEVAWAVATTAMMPILILKTLET